MADMARTGARMFAPMAGCFWISSHSSPDKGERLVNTESGTPILPISCKWPAMWMTSAS
jgi:hypothetical protein